MHFLFINNFDDDKNLYLYDRYSVSNRNLTSSHVNIVLVINFTYVQKANTQNIQNKTSGQNARRLHNQNTNSL